MVDAPKNLLAMKANAATPKANAILPGERKCEGPTGSCRSSLSGEIINEIPLSMPVSLEIFETLTQHMVRHEFSPQNPALPFGMM
jgi:hypothetical protein